MNIIWKVVGGNNPFNSTKLGDGCPGFLNCMSMRPCINSSLAFAQFRNSRLGNRPTDQSV